LTTRQQDKLAGALTISSVEKHGVISEKKDSPELVTYHSPGGANNLPHAMKPTRCQTCKEILFVGRPDPMEQNSSGLGGWYGTPLAVSLGSWRKLWRRKWHHQTCCGVYTDQTDRTGRWFVFGFKPQA
jgi:hypothetical protein